MFLFKWRYLKFILSIIITLLVFVVLFSSKEKNILNTDPLYFEIAEFIADDLAGQPQVDGRNNHGGIFYGISQTTITNGEAKVGLVLRPVLPKNHPNYYEHSTEFYYVLSIEQSRITLISRPDINSMKATYDSFLKIKQQES